MNSTLECISIIILLSTEDSIILAIYGRYHYSSGCSEHKLHYQLGSNYVKQWNVVILISISTKLSI